MQILALLKGYGLDRRDPTDADFMHTWIKCAKLAYADREAFCSDQKYMDVPLETLPSEDYNADRRKLVDPRSASMEQRPGRIAGFGGEVIVKGIAESRTSVSATGAGEPTVGRMGEARGDTVHVDIIDKHAN